jgi:hypothetical protein
VTTDAAAAAAAVAVAVSAAPLPMDQFLGTKRKAAAPPPVVERLAVSMTTADIPGVGRHAWFAMLKDDCPEMLTDAYHRALHPTRQPPKIPGATKGGPVIFAISVKEEYFAKLFAGESVLTLCDAQHGTASNFAKWSGRTRFEDKVFCCEPTLESLDMSSFDSQEKEVDRLTARARLHGADLTLTLSTFGVPIPVRESGRSRTMGHISRFLNGVFHLRLQGDLRGLRAIFDEKLKASGRTAVDALPPTPGTARAPR